MSISKAPQANRDWNAFFRTHLHWIALGLTCLYFGYSMMPRRDRADDWHFHDFGRLPIIADGRHKPMDTFARMNLMIITHRQDYYDDVEEKSYPATKWMLDTLTTPLSNDEEMGEEMAKLCPKGERDRVALKHKIFRIENDQVLQFLNLKMRERLRYSISEILPSVSELTREAARVRDLDPKKHTLFDAKIAELWRNLNLFAQIAGHSTPLIIPTADGTDQWKSFRGTYEEFLEHGHRVGRDVDTSAFATYGKLLHLYDAGEKKEFNTLLSTYLENLESSQPAMMRAIDREVFFNEFSPFYRCNVMYVFIALLGCLSWLHTPWEKELNRAAFLMMGVVFVVHTFGLIMRMDLQNRWFVFVTNLYSSAIFIGWGCVLVCLFTEYFYRNGIAIVVGSVTGFCTLLIAHFLSLSGDTMEMMQAVLDTNFWLATHVTSITLGYTAAFVAGFMGIAYILLGIFTPRLKNDGAANLTRMTYGVLCFGMLFSFVGTVLGGIWADQSWGRFWGWDPKENGALLIVIWIALILHARWGGMVKSRGIAVLAVLGNIVTAWSWFGTNFLGVGLHSYGFQQGAMISLVLADLVFLGIALLGAYYPLENWKSFQPEPVTAAGPKIPSGVKQTAIVSNAS